MNISVAKIARIMSEMVPARLAEDWDNVGLQVGHNDKEVKIILCALDFSAEVLEQAIQLHADIIITHHPAIFRGNSPTRTGARPCCWRRPGMILPFTAPTRTWTA